ncbi:MAG: serine hydrolase domain-containing protein [Thermoanaerobaculia bacterium]
MRLAQIVLAVALSVSLFAEPTDPKVLKSIETLMDSLVAQGMFQGNLLIAKNGVVELDKSYGLANIQWKQPNVSQSPFLAGSLTKVLTSMLVLKLAQDGKLDLNRTVSCYLPYYRQDTGHLIKISQLLDHSSGLPNYTELPDFPHLISRIKLPTREFVLRYCQPDLQSLPGKQFFYSNTGYFLLGAITEAVTGQRYEDSLKTMVLAPLGMTHTGYGWNHLILDKFAYGYQKQGCENGVAPFAEMSVPFSAGALYTTVGDLNKMNEGIENNTVLNEQYTEMMFDRHIIEVPFAPPFFLKGLYSSYGWDVGDLTIPTRRETVSVAMKSGVINGYNNYLTRTDDYMVAMLSNSVEAYSSIIDIAIVQMLYGAPVSAVSRYLTPTASNQLQNTICESGLQAALAQLKQTPPTSPATLSQVGNSFIGTGMESNVTSEQIDIALALFNLNAATFPTVPLVYEDLIAGYTLKSASLPMSLQSQ